MEEEGIEEQDSFEPSFSDAEENQALPGHSLVWSEQVYCGLRVFVFEQVYKRLNYTLIANALVRVIRSIVPPGAQAMGLFFPFFG